MSQIFSHSDRFHIIHIDIVGPFPSATLPSWYYPLPFRYLLTWVDREPLIRVDTSATSVALSNMFGWISRFGVPLDVVTDRGAQFAGERFSNLSSLLGFHHLRTTSYHRQSSRHVERLHRTLKSNFIARQENWLSSFPIVLLCLRMTSNSSVFSPSTAVTGSYMLCPNPLISNDRTPPISSE